MSNKTDVSVDKMDEEIPDFGQRFNVMRHRNHLVDCSFKVDDKIYHCHKLILSAASPVFEAMFYGSLAEKQTVKIADIRPSVFERMLDFIYIGTIDFENILQIEEILELYYCARKYMIDCLHKQCVNYFGNSINPNNVLPILDIAYSMNLEDIIFLCLCVLKHFLTSGMSLSNIILESSHHLSKNCVDLILEDNYEVKDNIICMIRAWCITECEQNRLEISSDSLKTILQDIELPEKLKDTIVDCCFTSFQPFSSPDKYNWTPVQRTHYKAVRPLIIGDEMSFEASISCNRFIVLKSISINSRLTPQLQPTDLRRDTYTENIAVEICSKFNNKVDPIYRKQHFICDVAFNNSLEIKLENHIVLFPDISYLIRLKWGPESLGYEYPRSILSSYGKSKQFRVNFSESIYLETEGSILSGIICDLYK
ncbi:BTB/POZ domain-containing protein 6 [Toxorhynchites rutilus septentrionalis]|uniref:BTB/POZ domain-containing protein 6 n=1 Tax=Toxorhynchites rutilus septentrionalis TaxID=329112 RepID=UPI00247879D9|nr:BTB/POZ domain-containing protein 6 [Toxorhynchites rutilus septentrionalis]